MVYINVNKEPEALMETLHVVETRGLTGASTVRAGHQLLGLSCLPVGVLVTQAEVTVVIGDDDPIWALLSCRQERLHIEDA